jgi:hypothetical protein
MSTACILLQLDATISTDLVRSTNQSAVAALVAAALSQAVQHAWLRHILERAHDLRWHPLLGLQSARDAIGPGRFALHVLNAIKYEPRAYGRR